MRSFLSIFAFLFSCYGILFAQDVQKIKKSIADFVNDTTFQHTNIGICVAKAQNEEIIAAYKAQKSLATASILKILTTATVLEQKGASFRYKTPVNYIGKIENGILRGNLIIQGVGDPTFNSKYFPGDNALKQIAQLLKEKGIRQIDGNLLIDISLVQSKTPRKWMWEDISNYYGATVHAVNFMDNFYKLTLRTGTAGTKAEILSTFPMQDLEIKSEVIASKMNADRAYIFGAPFSKERMVRGFLPQNKKYFSIKGAMPNPPQVFGKALLLTLKQVGITIRGGVEIAEKRANATNCLGTITSPTLKAIATETNRKSINLFAEALLLLTEDVNEHTINGHLKALKSFWKNKELEIDGLQLHDGSGLSFCNVVPPKFFVELLCYMKRSRQGKAFEETLSVSGINGTLKLLGRNTALTGKVKGKSGTMQQICCYVGYLTTQSGEEVAFAVMLNNFSISSHKARQKIAKMLMQW